MGQRPGRQRNSRVSIAFDIAPAQLQTRPWRQNLTCQNIVSVRGIILTCLAAGMAMLLVVAFVQQEVGFGMFESPDYPRVVSVIYFLNLPTGNDINIPLSLGWTCQIGMKEIGAVLRQKGGAGISPYSWLWNAAVRFHVQAIRVVLFVLPI